MSTYYQLLAKPLIDGNPSYKGLYRSGPRYANELPSNDPLNLMFAQYAGNMSLFSSLEDAVCLCELYNKIGQHFDVIEVNGPVNADVKPGWTFIGYDVAIAGWYSLLSWRMETTGDENNLSSLYTLIARYFVPRLSADGLFSNDVDARFFHSVVLEVSELRPGIFESERTIRGLDIYRLAIYSSDS